MVQKGGDSGSKPPSEFGTALELKNFNDLELPADTTPGDLGINDMVRCFGFDQGFKRCSLPGDRKITVESKGKRKTFYFCKHSHAKLLEQTGKQAIKSSTAWSTTTLTSMTTCIVQRPAGAGEVGRAVALVRAF